VIWAKGAGGATDDVSNNIVVDKNGNAFITGRFQSPIITFDSIILNNASPQNIFATKYDASGNALWAKCSGGPGYNNGMAAGLDANSNLYLAGWHSYQGILFDSITLPTTSNQQVNLSKISCITTSIINAIACNAYTSPSGLYTWTASGIYKDTIPNTTGCDSIITVNLNITNATVSMQSVTACNSYTPPSGNYNWTSSGLFTDTIMNTGGCDSIITINLTINTVDTNVTANGPNLFANAAGVVYQWIYCDSSLIAGATNQSFTATTNGSYAVIVSQNGCTDTSSCYTVLNVGIDEKGNDSALNVYPNPVNDVLVVSLLKPLVAHSMITISDMQGRVIKEEIIAKNNYKDISINVSTFSQGVYLLKVNENVLRFVKM
jgi:hypothetical protein